MRQWETWSAGQYNFVLHLLGGASEQSTRYKVYCDGQTSPIVVIPNLPYNKSQDTTQNCFRINHKSKKVLKNPRLISY